MDPVQKIVTNLPLVELWNSKGLMDAYRAEHLWEADIVRLLRDGSPFVVADVGQPLQWISSSNRFEFWKTEVKPRLVPPEVYGFSLDAYPGSYCCIAALWKRMSAAPVIVLEMYH